MEFKMLHNPRCRKSRESLAFLKEKGIEPEIILYLKTPPTFDELKDLVAKLGIEPLELVRKKEVLYKENFKGKELSNDEWINIMVEYPILIERPIVFDEKRAVIGRPTENILELL